MARLAVMTGVVVDANDRWFFHPQEAVVDQCCFDYAVALRSAAGPWELRLEQSFELLTPEGTSHLVVPEKAVHLDAVLRVLRAPIGSVCAFKDGRLEVQIGGWLFKVPSDQAFEAWTVTGPRGLRLVSMPGGNVAIWTPEP